MTLEWPDLVLPFYSPVPTSTSTLSPKQTCIHSVRKLFNAKAVLKACKKSYLLQNPFTTFSENVYDLKHLFLVLLKYCSKKIC